MHRIWEAEIDEASVVAELLAGFRDHLGRSEPGVASFEDSVHRLIERGDATFLLGALHDDAPPQAVAQLRFRYGLWSAGLDCYLEDLFVAESVRGQGLGRSMMEGVLQRAHERECRRVELDTEEHNETALALYGGFGFKSGEGEVGRRSLFLRHHVEE